MTEKLASMTAELQGARCPGEYQIVQQCCSAFVLLSNTLEETRRTFDNVIRNKKRPREQDILSEDDTESENETAET